MNMFASIAASGAAPRPRPWLLALSRKALLHRSMFHLPALGSASASIWAPRTARCPM